MEVVVETRLWGDGFEVLAARSEFDLGVCVRAGQVFRWEQDGPGVWSGWDGGFFWRAEEAEGGYRVWGDEGGFRRLFRLDEDFSGYRAEVVRVAPELAECAAGRAGLRLMRPGDVVEETFSFLCTSNNQLARIGQMVRVLAGYGEEGQFPEVEVIAGLGEEVLRGRGFGYRGATIPAAARAVVARGGRGWLEGLRRVGYEEAWGSLLELPGVGPKLADCVCLFALGYDRAVPVDTHVWQAVTRRWFPEWAGKAVTAGRYRAVGDLMRERFGDLAGYAHQLMFHESLVHGGKRGRRRGLGAR